MISHLYRVACSAALVVVLLVAPAAVAGEKPEQIYLLRGLMGVFSLGMDGIAERLEEDGIQVEVVSHISWGNVARKIKNAKTANPKTGPVIVGGHSLGAGAASSVAKRLAKDGIPVDLLISFGPAAEVPIPANVRTVLDIHSPAVGPQVKPVAGFKGKVIEMNTSKAGDGWSVNHFTIDKNKLVQDEVIAMIVKMVKRKRKL